jgi:hypothetical protein
MGRKIDSGPARIVTVADAGPFRRTCGTHVCLAFARATARCRLAAATGAGREPAWEPGRRVCDSQPGVGLAEAPWDARDAP